MLRRHGQKCASVYEVGLATASDEEISIFTDDKHAICVTQDREMITRRRRDTFGRHVYLQCDEWNAAEVLERHLDAVIELLQSREAIVVRVGPRAVKAFPSKWA